MVDATPARGFLGALSEDELLSLRREGRRRRFPRHTTIFREGETSDHAIVVISGRVKVSSLTDDGREVVYSVLGEGELLGELSALDGLPRSASVVALAPVEALVLTTDQLERFLVRHPRLTVTLLRTLSHRLRDSDRRRAEFSSDTPGRLARLIVELAERFGGTIPLSQEELAGWVGASRETVARALRLLRARGWIATRRRAIDVIDVAALRRHAT